MSSEKDLRQMYRSRTEGDFPDSVEVLGRRYVKIADLRYGTNPHQPAAFYRPANAARLVLGGFEILKTGKSGLSQTNMEDMHHAIGILKYMREPWGPAGAARPACAVMKHCNPSGVAIRVGDAPLVEVYQRARDADAQAAFGSVVVFNTEVDEDTAVEIMQTVVEGVAAPGFAPAALEAFGNAEKFQKNREIRVIKLPDFSGLPKFVGDASEVLEIKVFDDASMVLAKPYLSRVKGPGDLMPAYNEHKTKGRIVVARQPTPSEADDLTLAWYVNIHVRSNGVVLVRNGQTLAVGTGEQDRVGAVQQALYKAQTKYKGAETLEGAVLASDGFFPFRDSVDFAARAGVRAFVQPGGSVSDYEVIAACNELGVTMVFTGERCFSHH